MNDMAPNNPVDISYDFALKLRDLEESQKLSKERLLLIGQNLIEAQEKNISDITEIKKAIQSLNDELKRIKSIVSNLSEEISKSARKEELSMVIKQWKMFEPLEFVRIKDLDREIDKRLKHHGKETSKEETKENEKYKFWSGKL
ncbi:MAG: hypothetical protein QW727_00740 [Candidatus Pacearchaeota archaeon]